MKIILGSQSENRKHILTEAGYVFDVMVSNIDEKAIRHEDLYELPLRLSKAKAEALLPRIKEPAFLITADQVVVWNGELREKPANAEEARRYLETFSGSEYPAECVNGITVTNTENGKSLTEREMSKVFFSQIPQETIEMFLQSGIGFQKAGGFDANHPILKSFTRIEGTLDSVLGMPLDLVKRLLNEVT
ncbi:MAG: septum formation protein Maf [Candidatus Taylorbacteria bacterium]|nr:septum formation protein Maf [Candidatus Taylorbacteria bacterium]